MTLHCWLPIAKKVRIYCWWFRNPGDHQLRLVVYPIIYHGIGIHPKGGFLAGFLNHQQCPSSHNHGSMNSLIWVPPIGSFPFIFHVVFHWTNDYLPPSSPNNPLARVITLKFPWVFPKIGVPHGPTMDGLYWNNPVKMDGLVGKPHYFRKHPHQPSTKNSHAFLPIISYGRPILMMVRRSRRHGCHQTGNGEGFHQGERFLGPGGFGRSALQFFFFSKNMCGFLIV